jgi:hypothetical protein
LHSSAALVKFISLATAKKYLTWLISTARSPSGWHTARPALPGDLTSCPNVKQPDPALKTQATD